MECIYAFIHFASIVVVYRVVVYSQLGLLHVSTVFPAILFAITWLLIVTTFIWLKFPESLNDRKLIEQRGFFNGVVLIFALQAGMLM